MDAQELRKQLEQLNAEIDNAGSIDEEGLELLRDLNTHIQELLERSDGAAGAAVEVHPTTTRRLQENIGHFEVTHPTLTLALSNLLNTLSGSGI